MIQASELVKHLQKAIEEKGDLPIRYVMSEDSTKDFGDSHPVRGFVTLVNDDDTPHYFMIGDDAMLDSFQV